MQLNLHLRQGLNVELHSAHEYLLDHLHRPLGLRSGGGGADIGYKNFLIGNIPSNERRRRHDSSIRYLLYEIQIRADQGNELAYVSIVRHYRYALACFSTERHKNV